MQRRLIEGSRGSEYRPGGRDKLELAGRKKCRGDEVQSGSLNVSCLTWEREQQPLWWEGKRSAPGYTNDETLLLVRHEHGPAQPDVRDHWLKELHYWCKWIKVEITHHWLLVSWSRFIALHLTFILSACNIYYSHERLSPNNNQRPHGFTFEYPAERVIESELYGFRGDLRIFCVVL